MVSGLSGHHKRARQRNFYAQAVQTPEIVEGLRTEMRAKRGESRLYRLIKTLFGGDAAAQPITGYEIARLYDLLGRDAPKDFQDDEIYMMPFGTLDALLAECEVAIANNAEAETVAP